MKETETQHLFIQPADYSKLVCDFCSYSEVTHAFDAKDHNFAAIGTLTLVSTGAWASCAACADMIRKGDRKNLLKRSLERLYEDHPEIPRGCRNQLREKLRTLHDGFFANRKAVERN